jgi:hypothetical protein
MKRLLRIGIFCLLFMHGNSGGFAQVGIITTYARSGIPANGALATTQGIESPTAVALDGNGGFYVASYPQHSVYRVSADGKISLAAGNGTEGYSGDANPATSAQLSDPRGLAVDSAGSLFISDNGSSCIRKVNSSGIITSVAGNETGGYSGDGGPATLAQLQSPYGIAVDSTGNLFIADRYNHRIRKVNSSGVITTVAGNASFGFSGDDGPATSAGLSDVWGVAVDSAGNLYIADSWNRCIRKVDSSGIITTVAGNASSGYSGDGGGYTTSLILMNASNAHETGILIIINNNRVAFAVHQAGGMFGSSFSYSISPNGIYRFQTDGSPVDWKAGWVQLTPDPGTSTPVGSGIFGYNPEKVLVTESGIPSTPVRHMPASM